MKMNRIIRVPRSIEAKKRLEYSENKEHDLVDIYVSEQHINDLYKTNIISELNDELDLLISDYEEESIEDEEKLKGALKIVKKYLAKPKYKDVFILKVLEVQLLNALIYKTSIHFEF